MSNPDIPNQEQQPINSLNDFLLNNKVCLFNFSNLKSQTKMTLSEINNFNYDLTGNEQNDTKNDKINTKKEADNNRYIKNINIDLPSSEKLSNEEYKTSFINEYEDSFPCFCGLNKEQFTKIYVDNNYKPNVDELGDINVYVKKIVDVLEDFSDNKQLKISRRAHKKNRIKKYMKISNANLAPNKPKNKFHIIQTDKMEKKNENSSHNLNNEENIKKDKKKDKEEINDNNQNSQSLFSENNNNINSESINDNDNKNKKQKTLSNIKQKLKNISIPAIKNKSLNSKDNSSNYSSSHLENKIISNEQKTHSCNINNSTTNNVIFKDININDSNKKILLDNNKNFLNSQVNSSNLSFQHNLNSTNNNNNNIFNFSSNIIQNFSNSQQNKSMNDIPIKNTLSPFNINNNLLNLSLNNNLNNNTPSNRPVLSPMNYNPDLGNVLSPCLPKSNIASPFLINLSPFNNNNFFNDHFAFNNANTSSFFFGNNENNDDNKNENKNNDNVNPSNEDINNNNNNNNNIKRNNNDNY